MVDCMQLIYRRLPVELTYLVSRPIVLTTGRPRDQQNRVAVFSAVRMSLDVLLQAAHYVDHKAKKLPSAQPAKSTGNSCGNESLSGADTLRADSVTSSVTLSNRSETEYAFHMHSESPSSDDSGKSHPKARSSKRKNSCSVSQDKDKCRRGSVKPNTENRSVHNVLEKNRRAHLKDCFDNLKHEVMETDDEKKASHLAVLKNAVRCIQQLQRQTEQLQKETERALKDRSSTNHRLHEAKRDIMASNPCFDLASFLRGSDEEETDSQATCTAPGSPSHHLDPVEEPFAEPPKLDTKRFVDQSSVYLSTLSLSPKLPNTFDFPQQDLFPPPLPLSVDDSYHTPEPKPRFTKKTAKQAHKPPPNIEMISDSTVSVNEADSSMDRAPLPVPNAEGKRNLPIKLRILQDQQEGLFKEEPNSAISPISPAESDSATGGESSGDSVAKPSDQTMESPYSSLAGYWPSGSGYTAFPFYAHQGGMPMFSMNHVWVPVTTHDGSSVPQIMMLPAVGMTSGYAAMSQPERDSSPSSEY